MRRLCVLALILFVCLGCATDSDKAQWAEVVKDLRGENMQMRSDQASLTTQR
jgi:uncharacterized protein YcfL